MSRYIRFQVLQIILIILKTQLFDTYRYYLTGITTPGQSWSMKRSHHTLQFCSVCNILICRCMQKHIQHNKDEQTQFFRKIYLSFYSKGFERVTKGFMCERWVWDWTELQHIDPPTLLATAAFLSRSPGLLSWGPGGLGAQPLLGHGSHSSIFSKWLPVAPRLYNYLTPTNFLWRHISHSVQPIDSPDIFDRMHLLFTQVHLSSDSPAGSEVNILHAVRSTHKHDHVYIRLKGTFWVAVNLYMIIPLNSSQYSYNIWNHDCI